MGGCVTGDVWWVLTRGGKWRKKGRGREGRKGVRGGDGGKGGRRVVRRRGKMEEGEGTGERGFTGGEK